MVCSVGSGRMAVMARLLEARSFSQNVAGYIGNQKLVAQYLCKEIFEADEPNLLDEEDMHVFGLKPMDDPLHLVCCNTCKKPVKASHYAAHADLCRFLSSTRDAKVEPNYGTERRKPPRRKQRGQVVSADCFANPFGILHEDLNQLAAGRKQETGSLMDAHDSITSETYGDGELSAFYSVAKAGNYPRYTLPHSRELNHNAVAHTCHHELHDNEVQNQNVPAPLATKIYYNQRNNRLRSEIGHMFWAADSQELDTNLTQAMQQDITRSRSSSPPGQNSGTKLMTAGKVSLAGGSSDQPSVDEALRQEASSAMLRGTEIPKFFLGNAGSVQESVPRTDGDAPCTDIFAQRFY